MLERMEQFFEKRLEGYDEHMRTEVECGAGFYQFTAEQLPKAAGAEVLDLGCGTRIGRILPSESRGTYYGNRFV